MVTLKTIAQMNTVTDVIVESLTGAITTTILFQTEPLDRTFCYRVLQIQLITQSCDQGVIENDPMDSGSGSWFEIMILRPGATTKKNGKDKVLLWHSHNNSFAVDEMTLHGGKLFDRRHQLLNSFQAGDVIAVRACAERKGWMNKIQGGKLTAKLLEEDTFVPNPWSITSGWLGTYTVTESQTCRVSSGNQLVTSKIWFLTPPLNSKFIARLKHIQLFTRAHCSRKGSKAPSDPVEENECWFDLAIFTSEDGEPKTKKGRSLVWRSHSTTRGKVDEHWQNGMSFHRQHELFHSLEPGDMIAVRVCAQFVGRVHIAHSGRLTVTTTTEEFERHNYEWESGHFVKYLEMLKKMLTEQQLHSLYSFSAETQKAAMIFRADSTHGAGSSSLKLLSLDGGGVRGISSLQILQELESTMLSLTGHSEVKPCDYFDMIAGTSTGGLIAIMLGRLEMSIHQCIGTYRTMSAKIFGKRKGDWYDHHVLEDAVKDLVKRYLGNPEEPMRPMEGSKLGTKCKVFVVACKAKGTNVTTPTHIRTYRNTEIQEPFAAWKIWEAARATSAAPTFFQRITVGGVDYIDGGLNANNPVLLLYAEAGLVFGRARRIQCLLTIGTGLPPPVTINNKRICISRALPRALEAIRTMADTQLGLRLLTSGEQIHCLFREYSIVPKEAYYRFNHEERDDGGEVQEPISLDGWLKMEALQHNTIQYLESQGEMMEKCARVLAEGLEVPSE
ncbi:hypothetical protein QCA50_009556 [Cerrena zonata]|uniref:PNPLA domain-containing protein n=1 Tax=Cerrena zonata TaxID=2478898 RepID=A0AAW0G214_9APHY